MYKIEKNIEMPNPAWGGVTAHKYPFYDMKIGDSFAINVDPTTNLNYKQVAARVQGSISSHKKRQPNVDFSVRTLRDQKCLRIWRTK